MSDICNGLVCGYEQVVYAMTDSLHAYLQSITNIDNLQSARSLKL